MTSSQHPHPEADYLHPSFQFRRAMWATIVAVTCGAIGGAVALFSVVTGYEFAFLRDQTKLNSEFAQELIYDFDALRHAEAVGDARPIAGAGDVQMPVPANFEIAASTDDAAQCTEGTWPFLDNGCLWGATGQQWHRRRIVLRLKSPWCAGLRVTQGAYNCRGRR
jgi:hypothetical protein